MRNFYHKRLFFGNERGGLGLRLLLLLFVAGVIWALYTGYLKWNGPHFRVPKVSVK
jgi:hypothetical protein